MPAEPRFKPKPFSATVTEVVRETPETVTLVLTADQPVEYRAGQFLTIDPRQFEALAAEQARLEQAKGKKELTRAYSMSSAPHEPLAVTIKEEPFVEGASAYRPLLSPMLVHGLRAGDRLDAVGFTGPYTWPPDVAQNTEHVLHVVAGSGVVPNFSLLKHALKHHPSLRHTVVDSNKTWGDVIFRDQLAALAAQHADQLQVVHFLTRQSDLTGLPGDVRSGRITPEALKSLLLPNSLVYVCGPSITRHQRHAALQSGVPAVPQFLETMLDWLTTLGVPKERLKRESFG